jgi:hypothetical protein
LKNKKEKTFPSVRPTLAHSPLSARCASLAHGPPPAHPPSHVSTHSHARSLSLPTWPHSPVRSRTRSPSVRRPWTVNPFSLAWAQHRRVHCRPPSSPSSPSAASTHALVKFGTVSSSAYCSRVLAQHLIESSRPRRCAPLLSPLCSSPVQASPHCSPPSCACKKASPSSLSPRTGLATLLPPPLSSIESAPTPSLTMVSCLPFPL